MATVTSPSLDRTAESFINYLFEQYPDHKHVRKVAAWFGFLLKAIAETSGGEFRRLRRRQLGFRYRAHRFKARYHHKVSARGGIEIVEVLPLQVALTA